MALSAVGPNLSLGLVGMDWSMGSPQGPLMKDEDDDDCALRDLDTHLAATVSALLDDADTPVSGPTTLRVDAPEFVPMQHAPPTVPPPAAAPRMPPPAPAPAPAPAPLVGPSSGGSDGPALRSYWADSSYRIEWKVPCTKLLSKDKIVVSPAFGDVAQARTFKLLLQPRSKPGPGEEHGCPAFGSTRYGALQLKCVEDRDTAADLVCFRLFIGEEPSVILRHNFKSCAVAVHEHLWDLRSEVDGRSRTLNVGVEFLEC